MWSRKTGAKEMHVHYLGKRVFSFQWLVCVFWQAIQASLLQENSQKKGSVQDRKPRVKLFNEELRQFLSTSGGRQQDSK